MLAIAIGIGVTIGGVPAATHPGNNLLMETGDNLLLETGDAFLLE